MAKCILCEMTIKGTVRSVRGSFWESWRSFCHRNNVKSFEEDLLDNGCYCWVRKYGSEDLGWDEPKDSGFKEPCAKKSIIANSIRNLLTTRPLMEDVTESLKPFENMDVDVEQIPEPEIVPKKTPDESRRIVSSISLCEFVRDLSEHGKSCQNFGFAFCRENRVGLQTKMSFKCNCGQEFKVESDSGKESLPVNDGMVWGCAQAPLGYDAATAFLTAMDLRGPGRHTFKKLHRKTYEVLSKAAEETMTEAGKLEKQLAIDSGDFVDVQGKMYPSATIKVDGGWAKRSYGHGFNSHCGTAVGIGAKTKKILFNDTRVRTCVICDKAEKKGEDPKPHECFNTWNKASTAMESNIIQQGFQNSITSHGLVYSKFVGDGDSSTHAAVLDVYPGLKVQKIECTNHVMRNLTKKLMDIYQNRKKNIPASIRKISGMATRFERITGGIIGAVNYHISTLSSESWKQLRADVTNVPRHVFGDHTFCKDYFCRKNNQDGQDQNIFLLVANSPLYADVMDAVNSVASLAISLLERMNTNEAECFMSVLNKYLEGKRKHYGHRYDYNLRVACSVLAYNTTTFWSADAYETAFHRTPSTLWEEKKQQSINNRNKLRSKLIRRRPKYSFLKSSSGDKNYGSCPDKPDLEETDKTEFGLRLIELHNSLQLTDARRIEIEANTRDQASSEIWFQERLPRITASVAHAVARLRPSTDNTATLNAVLGRTRFSSEDTLYGKDHEAIATQEYEKIRGFQPGHVRPAGLVISGEDGILAASPDGFVGTEGLLEVKCPSKWRDFDAKTWPRLLPPKKQRTLNDEPELKSSDPYYTQVLMQLYITGKKWIDFFVWSPNGSFVQRIHQDDVTRKLWERTKVKLIDFWRTEIAPELVDSRYLRGREYRCPKSREKSRAKLQAKSSNSSKKSTITDTNSDMD